MGLMGQGLVMMIAGMLLFWTIPHTLLGLFNASDRMMEIGTVALRTISISFPFAGFAVMRSACFQALGKSSYSMYVSIARQLVVLLPVAYLLTRFFAPDVVWLAFPIAEIAGISMCIYFSRKVKREIIAPLGEDDE